MHLNCATAKDVLKTVKDEDVQMVDLRFTDLPGVWQHFSVPPSAVDPVALEEGIGFDGSSIRGFQEIQESDMLVVPDATDAVDEPDLARRCLEGGEVVLNSLAPPLEAVAQSARR